MTNSDRYHKVKILRLTWPYRAGEYLRSTGTVFACGGLMLTGIAAGMWMKGQEAITLQAMARSAVGGFVLAVVCVVCGRLLLRTRR